MKISIHHSSSIIFNHLSLFFISICSLNESHFGTSFSCIGFFLLKILSGLCSFISISTLFISLCVFQRFCLISIIFLLLGLLLALSADIASNNPFSFVSNSSKLAAKESIVEYNPSLSVFATLEISTHIALKIFSEKAMYQSLVNIHNTSQSALIFSAKL
jgi:hypothetical protein